MELSVTPQSPSRLNAEAWEHRYQEGTTRWDLGQPSPIFVDLFQAADAPKPGTAVVLGAGRGHDARLFAQHRFEVTAVDFAPSAVAAIAYEVELTGIPLRPLQRNIFDLVPDYAGMFDYVIEHTCFCAIDPAQRPAYVKLVAQLLKPRGELLAVFFTHNRPGGPPYGSNPQQLRALFEPYFVVKTLEPVMNSVPSRRGEEHLGRFQLRR
jgi:SAM-dependent methyltransferase